MKILLLIIAYLIFNTAGLSLLKMSTLNLKLASYSDYLELFTKPEFILGFLLYAASFLAWVVMLSKKDISYIYPIVIGLSYIVIMITAIILFRDSFTLNKALGSTLIGLGVIFISL